MWGVVPAAGRGSRIQPLAFSKELLPVGSRSDKGMDRPCAVSEYLIERLILGGADKICFVISPGKSDILMSESERNSNAKASKAAKRRRAGPGVVWIDRLFPGELRCRGAARQRDSIHRRAMG